MNGIRIQFWRLLEPEHAKAEAFCRKLAGGRDDGDDLYQDALVSALSAFEQLRDLDSFRPWLYRIIVNQFRNRTRSGWFRRRQPLTDEVVQSHRTEHPESKLAARRTLSRALARLSATDRALVVLFELEGWSIRELAGMTGKSETAIKARLARARSKMREHLMRAAGRQAPVKDEGSASEICAVPRPGND